ncbi:hypothetical protein ACQJBY_018642 [Aegilops geniculata]
MTASTWTAVPSESTASELVKRVMPGTTVIWPHLILARAPVSSTGARPCVCLSVSGPTAGRWMPSLSRSPRTSQARKIMILSTIQSGSHAMSSMASSKVDLPSTSRGMTCMASRTTMKGWAPWSHRSRDTSMPEFPQPTTSTRFPL